MAIRVMLVDDSGTVRALIKRALTADANIEVIAAAADGAEAVRLAKKHQPDIVLLDIEMPVMDGIKALPQILEAAANTKVIMASTLTLHAAAISLKALELGASDYVAKPSASTPDELENFYRELSLKIYALNSARKRQPTTNATTATPGESMQRKAFKLAPSPATQPTVRALAIASSTGGPQALIAVMGGLKKQLKHIPIFITQHMPPNFTTILAEHLSKAGERPCREAKQDEAIAAGHAYVAPGNYHMTIEKRLPAPVLRLNQDPQVNFCRPSADPMLRSLSMVYGAGLLTVVLTGMGSDGLEGAKAAVKNGGHVIAQDEATSVVWGMPRAVAEEGICQAVLPLTEIAPYLLRMI